MQNWVDSNPYRMMRGQATAGPSAGNFSLVGLFNNDSGTSALIVRDIQCIQITAQPFFFGQVASNPGAVVANAQRPLWYNRGMLSGQIVTATPAAAPAFSDWSAGIQGNYSAVWGHDWPIAVIGPGECFYAISQGVNSTMQIAFVWVVRRMDELEHLIRSSAPPEV